MVDDGMDCRLFAIEIVNGSEVRLSFDTTISVYVLDKWKERLGETLRVYIK